MKDDDGLAAADGAGLERGVAYRDAGLDRSSIARSVCIASTESTGHAIPSRLATPLVAITRW